MNHRVVITGIGLCTPVGREVAAVWDNLLAGRSGIGPITLFAANSLPVRIGGEVKNFHADAVANAFPGVRDEPDRKVWLGLDAALQAIQDAGLDENGLGAAQVHVGVSLEYLAFEQVVSVLQAVRPGEALGARLLGGWDRGALQTPLDRLAELVGDRFGCAGGRFTNCSACAAGAQAIGEAFRRIRAGAVDRALAGATDSALNPLGLGGFSLLHILSTENDAPQTACRPFDASRQGTVLSEGAAFLVLESLDAARARAARVYAEVLGYGSSLDAYRVSDPEPTGRGAVLSMRRALADAGLSAEAVDCVNAHGTGTPKNDAVETLAIKTVLGQRARLIPVHSVKSMTGHMIATSGAFEAAVAALTLMDRNVPPTINLAHPDPHCDLDYVTEGCRAFAGETVLSNSFGFGGQNASLVLRRC